MQSALRRATAGDPYALQNRFRAICNRTRTHLMIQKIMAALAAASAQLGHTARSINAWRDVVVQTGRGWGRIGSW